MLLTDLVTTKEKKDTITYNRYVKLAEGLAIQQVGASVGHIFSVTLWGLWGDIAKNLPLFLNLLPDLQVFKVRVGTVAVVRFNIVQLDGIDYYSQSLLNHFSGLLHGCVYQLDLDLLPSRTWKLPLPRVLGLRLLFVHWEGATFSRLTENHRGRRCHRRRCGDCCS